MNFWSWLRSKGREEIFQIAHDMLDALFHPDFEFSLGFIATVCGCVLPFYGYILRASANYSIVGSFLMIEIIVGLLLATAGVLGMLHATCRSLNQGTD
jgi:hypothetical protein